MAASNLDTTSSDNTIDALLHRYLILLDEYTTLRSILNQLQSGIYQNIARANFSAERGIRYGQDFYDDRMQALRRVVIQPAEAEETASGDGGSSGGIKDGNARTGQCPFSVQVVNRDLSSSGGHFDEAAKGGREEEDVPQEGAEENEEGAEKEPAATSDPMSTAFQEKDQEQKVGQEEKENDASNSESEKKPATPSKNPKSADPLRWFGLFTPQPLRQAQSQAIKVVEEILPRLVTVNVAMAEVELEVRRTRKKRTKAVAAAASATSR